MTKVTVKILGYEVGKVGGSRGEFGRMDQWAVIRVAQTVSITGISAMPPFRSIMSRHNSESAAKAALKKRVK